MSSRARLLWAVVLAVTLLFVATGTFAAVTVWRAGSIALSVDPRGGTESGLSLRIPAIVIPVAVALVPDAVIRDLEPGLGAAMTLALKACDVLEDQGDAVFVEVSRPGERVSVAKVGGDVRIDVVTEDDEIHVAVPLASLRAVVSRVDRALAPGGARV